MERIMEFVNLETDLRGNFKFNCYLNTVYKESRHVWQDLLLEFGQDKYLENGFMIFITDEWLKEFAKFTGVTVPKLKKILELFSKENLIVSKLFSQNILFSENFLRNHAGFFMKFEKKFKKRREKFEKNIQFFLEIQETKSKNSITYKDVLIYFDNILASHSKQKNAHNNNNNNKNNNNNINLESDDSDLFPDIPKTKSENPPIEILTEFAEVVNEADKKAKTTFEHNTWQYEYAEKLEKIFKERDPNAPDLNLQDGARMFDKINSDKKWGYSCEQINTVIDWMEYELNKSSPPYPFKKVNSFHTFNQFFRAMLGEKQNGITADYESRATEIASQV